MKYKRFILPLIVAFSVQAQAICPKPWILFDSGQTLIDTQHDTYKNMTNWPGAVENLQQLASAQYTLGLVVNIPKDMWINVPVDQVRAKQVIGLNDFIKKGWRPGAPPFPWYFFGQMKGSGRNQTFHGPVFFPSEDIYRKPNLCANCLLNQVAQTVRAQGCFAIYMGEDEKEMIAAQQVGLIPFWVGHTDKTSFYLRREKINLYIQKIMTNPNAWRGLN